MVRGVCIYTVSVVYSREIFCYRVRFFLIWTVGLKSSVACDKGFQYVGVGVIYTVWIELHSRVWRGRSGFVSQCIFLIAKWALSASYPNIKSEFFLLPMQCKIFNFSPCSVWHSY